jgi:hypothetical protein
LKLTNIFNNREVEMKKSKTWLILLMSFLIVLIAYAGSRQVFFGGKAINTKTAATDTSAWKDLRFAEYAEITTGVFNTDSGCFQMQIDAKYANYIVTIAYDTLAFNTSTTFTSTLPYKSFVLRGLANSYPGIEYVRTRTYHKKFTNGSEDTNAYYNQYLILRP